MESKETKLTIIKNGPLAVEGVFTVVGTDGNVLKETKTVYLCRCHKSANKPYCDGSHKKIGFKEDE